MFIQDRFRNVRILTLLLTMAPATIGDTNPQIVAIPLLIPINVPA